MPSADYKVELVDSSGEADMTVAVIGDQVVDLSGATPGDVLTIQGDGTVAPDTPSSGGAAGGVLSGTYPNPGFAVDMATQAELDAKVTQTITNGVTASAPSEDAVFDALALKAPLASPTFTGTVNVAALAASGAITAGGTVSATNTLTSDGAAGSQRSLLFRTGSSNRWQVYADSGSESGSNAGSDLSIAAYTDAGASLATYLTVKRSSGRFTFANTVDLEFSSVTGTKIGVFTNSKFAFHGSAPVIQRASADQTAVATTGATSITPFGYTTAAQANAIVTLVNELRAALVEKGLIKGAA